ncbi:EscU/YscU/HrcU family type III secretion system export apparatus switch protein [Achromobacter aloeverae]|uniref:Flagellar biosynthesis protein FlhB n=1 Tax=Achromobacter aloeverae TaxID=1750518 RepID=A0A4Q1HNZ8_9BURK|nr:EscU/YscU/HrcU family type III secretion system export apparatus switch protein [Achromobacter aloeverae]RXN92537.1 flagellar biosynthesis protein FlhB [Achromobacter aloeverae]
MNVASKQQDAGDDRQVAVALSYNEAEAAPRVVAKGYGTLADTIIRTAQEHGLYVHQSPELVGLLMQVNLDAQIPPELYVAVAELLAWLYRVESGGAEAAKEALLAAMTPRAPATPGLPRNEQTSR